MKKKFIVDVICERFAVYLFCAVIVLATSGCEPQAQEATVEGMSVSEGEHLPGRLVQHARGTAQIEGIPRRVVILTNEATDTALALGITPVGAVKSWSGDPYYDYIAADMVSVEVVGDELQPNLEKIAALKPDLILGSELRHAQIYPQLSAIAPTVFSETIGVTWQQNLKLYAEALGQTNKASVLLNNWSQRVADFKQKIGDRVIEVSLVRLMPGTARVYFNDSFPGDILAELGLARPAAQNKDDFAQEISLEQISLMEGDVLFYFTFSGVNAEQSSETVAQPWLTHPLWKKLKVVERGSAYGVSDVVWTSGGGIQAANLLLDDLYTYLDL